MKQATLDRIRQLNKAATNKLLIHLCGKKFGHFAILGHLGRKSGRLYQIPIIAEPYEDGFVIALTYGKKVDWLKNVLARGSCSLRWKNRDYALVHPEFVSPERSLLAFPAIFRSGLRMMGIEYFLRLRIQGDL
ncbi:MAG: nitroreductase family deazaflavin-dependent oxidoreductase [Anaerolineales bacterium]|nr:MAG: nitroreductase family deazaflavin-dependent oxidoreductase [Anaerolineales bacterium]